MFTLAPKKPRPICVMATRGHEWIAGGVDSIIEGSVERNTEQAFDGLAVEALGVAVDGSSYAEGRARSR